MRNESVQAVYASVGRKRMLRDVIDGKQDSYHDDDCGGS
jgi:hypothetical protein